MNMSEDDDLKEAYNRAPIFKGINYTYWKSIMYVQLLSVNKDMWWHVTERPFIPEGDEDVVKHPKHWDDTKTKNSSYDLKVRNILIYALSAKVFYSISHHTNVKGMLDAL